MLEESIEHAEQDFTQRQLIESRLEGEAILQATAKSLARLEAEAPGEAPESGRSAIEAAAAALRAALAGEDYKLIRARTEEMNQATLPLAERMMNRALSGALAGKRLSDV
jgi:molecular chaperone DnaK (HSP70)